MAHVELKSIGKSYGRHEVLKEIDLSVDDGEFVVLVGPSGCGKSTLLRMIAGLEPITSGTLEIDGRRMNDVEARNRDIAMVFQSYALYPHMSVQDNIGFPLRVRGIPESDLRTKVGQTARNIGLEDLLERKPKELSGGQRQRVAMGRAIVRDPRVFLFDEPLSNLDAKLRVKMRQQIRDLHRRISATSIYVTHDQVEAMTLADRVVLLKDGHIQQVGEPMELYSKPSNVFVAGFIGSPEMNFLAVEVDKHAERPRCFLSDGTELPFAPQGRNQEQAILAVRPEDLELGESGVPGTIVDVEYLGSETHLLIDTAAGRVTCVVRVFIGTSIGQRVHLRMAPERVHFFDSASGERLP